MVVESNIKLSIIQSTKEGLKGALKQEADTSFRSRHSKMLLLPGGPPAGAAFIKVVESHPRDKSSSRKKGVVLGHFALSIAFGGVRQNCGGALFLFLKKHFLDSSFLG